MLTFMPFKIWCLENGKERKDVVRDTGINKTTVDQIFREEFPFKTTVIERICKAYGLRVEQVIQIKLPLSVE